MQNAQVDLLDPRIEPSDAELGALMRDVALGVHKKAAQAGQVFVDTLHDEIHDVCEHYALPAP